MLSLGSFNSLTFSKRSSAFLVSSILFSELIITLNKIDETKKAEDLFEKVSELKDPKDNIFWMGYVFDDGKYWPIEKPTWTAAAYILAANALNGFNSAGDFFKNL